MEDRTGQGQPLLVTAGQGSRQLSQAVFQAHELNNHFAPAIPLRAAETVDRAVEVEILLDGEIFIKAETLRHVPDPPLDLFGLLYDVEAVEPRAPRAGLQKAAEHADHRGFAGTVGTEEAEDFPRFDVEAHVIDRHQSAELFGEAFRLDHATH